MSEMSQAQEPAPGAGASDPLDPLPEAADVSQPPAAGKDDADRNEDGRTDSKDDVTLSPGTTPTSGGDIPTGGSAASDPMPDIAGTGG